MTNSIATKSIALTILLTYLANRLTSVPNISATSIPVAIQPRLNHVIILVVTQAVHKQLHE
jgi:hypothetical protein